MKPERLTVVVCTHDRADLLSRTLESLESANRPEESVSILVIANHCTDTTHDLLASRQARPNQGVNFRWLAEPMKGKSHALNLALKAATGDLVAFVDDDQRVGRDFLRATCAAASREPDADIICGRLLPDWDGSEPAWIHEAEPYRVYPLPVPVFDMGDQPAWLTADATLPSGGNLVVRRELIGRVGEFATNLGPVGHNLGGAEDSEWLLRALGLGARLLYEPTIVQRHHVDPDRLSLSYLLKLSYARTSAAVAIEPGNGSASAPAWAYRKVVSYGARALTSVSPERRRFYLMRCAAALGEINGYKRRRNTLVR